jgi:hypothetical protein
MSLDDLLEPEVVVAVGVTAALMSPPVRRVLRKGAVYGLAGVMIVGDKIAAMARGVRDRTASSSNHQETAGATEQPAPGPVAS